MSPLVSPTTTIDSGTARIFSYIAAFSKTEATCKTTFGPAFAHIDWHDGQDLVQAEQSAGEEGFNLRFHRIEADFDAVKTEFNAVYACMAALRASVADRFSEILAELNRINRDLAELQECCEEGPTLQIQPFDEGRYIGIIPWEGIYMHAIQTKNGVTLVPKGPTPRPGPGPGPPEMSGRAGTLFKLGRLLHENDEIRTRFAGDKEPSVQELIDDFGDLDVDGQPLEDLLRILPPGSRYASPETMLAAAGVRHAAAIRTDARAGAIVFEMLGFQEADHLTDALIEGMEGLSEDAKAALAAEGITTLGELSEQDPIKLAGVFEHAGVEIDAGGAAGLIAAAMMMGEIY